MRPPEPLRRLRRVAVSGVRGAARRIGAGLKSLAGDDEELREGEEQLRLALEAASLGLWHADLDTGEFVASPGARAMHGLPPGTPLDLKKALEVVHPDDRDLVREHVERSIAQRWPYEVEFRVVRPDDSVRWMLSRGRAYERGANGGGGRLVGVVQDITARKQAEEENVQLLWRERAAHVEAQEAEEALKENETRFRLLAEKTSDLICLHEPDGRYVYVSPSCRRLLGYEPDELIGVDPYDLFHPEDARLIRSEAHANVLEGQSAVSVTYRIRKKSGEYTWFETLTEPIVDESGAVVRLQTSSRDVSDRKHAEEALAEAARARTEFLAEVSHELRTPLTVIRGNAEVGLKLGRGCLHEEVLEEIVKEAATMSRMVEDLLLLARSDSLSPPFELQPVAVEPFLAGLEKGAEALAQEHGARLDADLAGTGWVEMEPSRVKQAVLALVHNAAKFGPQGEPVSLSSATPDGELRIEVEDRGSGIPEEHLPRIFERFYRVDVPGEPGSGLGLSVAKSIAEAHSGRIEAERRPGEGMKMSLCLPLLAREKIGPAER